MSPRRPTPARPGSRPGARPARRSASRAAAPAPGRTSDKPPSPRAPRVSRPDSVTAPAPEHTVLRLGGSDGVTVPARVLIIALVLLGAFIITFPSLRGYLSQRAQYDAILRDIAEAEATSTALESELAQWQDDDYVRSQARERLSYVMPGETTYVVVGAEAFEEQQAGSAAATAADNVRPWYETVRESARVAGQTGEQEPAADPAQQGWSTSVPTVPTPSAGPTPDTSTSDDEP